MILAAFCATLFAHAMHIKTLKVNLMHVCGVLLFSKKAFHRNLGKSSTSVISKTELPR